MTTSLEYRVTNLETEAVHTAKTFEAQTGRLDHLTNAVGDLSGDLRAFRHEVAESFAAVTKRLNQIEANQATQGAKLDQIITMLAGKPPAV